MREEEKLNTLQSIVFAEQFAKWCQLYHEKHLGKYPEFERLHLETYAENMLREWLAIRRGFEP